MESTVGGAKTTRGGGRQAEYSERSCQALQCHFATRSPAGCVTAESGGILGAHGTITGKGQVLCQPWIEGLVVTALMRSGQPRPDQSGHYQLLSRTSTEL